MSCDCVDDLAIACTETIAAGARDEELLNGVTHAAGAVLSVAGSLVLGVGAWVRGRRSARR